MTIEKIRSIIEEYKLLFKSRGIKPNRIEDYSSYAWTVENKLGHACWMTHQVGSLLDQGRIEKAFRWLGFIQGCLFSEGIKNLNDLKSDSRPDPDKEQK